MKNSQSEAGVAKKSRFSVSDFGVVEAVSSGARISNDTLPQIESCSQLNKFKLNKLASELMGVVPENRVKIIVTKAPTLDGKFLIAVAKEDEANAAKLLSPTAKDGFGSLLFNYAGVWSRIAQFDVDAVEKSAAALVAEGVAIDRGKTTYINRKVIYTLEEVEDFNVDSPLVLPTGEQYTKVFALVDGTTEAADLSKVIKPRAKKEETTADVVVEPNEDIEA